LLLRRRGGAATGKERERERQSEAVSQSHVRVAFR
jgi:hypothetical protein